MGGLAAVRLSDPLPVSVVRVTASAVAVVPGSAPALPWAATGQSAVDIPALGIRAQSGPETPVSVASLTKLMTAYVILRDHPLAAGQSGPSVTLTATDESDFDQDTETDEANVEVQAGEVLTEQQLLEGLVVRSANDLADTLARWDAGSIPAFVAKMNADAAALGMTQTHYVDANGFQPASQSTRGRRAHGGRRPHGQPDVLQHRRHDLGDTAPGRHGGAPTRRSSVTDGVVGVKSGFLMAAGGCDVLAAVRNVGGIPVLVLASDTGQGTSDPLGQAGSVALNIADAAAKGMVALPVVRRGEQLALVTAAGRSVPVTSQHQLLFLGWPGMVVHRRVEVVQRPARRIGPGRARRRAPSSPSGSSAGRS